MKAAAPGQPQYIGGPLCGDVISVNAPAVLRVINPIVGGEKAVACARGTFVYPRVETTGDFRLVEVRG